MERKLIFDIGFHKGEDTRYYLYRGYDVVAVDAAPDMIAQGKRMFSKEMDEGRLTLLNYIVAREKDTFPEFYISENSEWSSMHRKYPRKPHLERKAQTVPGTVVLGSDTKDFSHPDTLGVITQVPKAEWTDLSLSISRPYRYYRVQATQANPHLFLAELQFLTERSRGYANVVEPVPLHGNMASALHERWVRLLDEPLEKCGWKAEYDGNVQTAPDAYPHVTLRLEKPQWVDRLRFMVKHADNGISPGDTYVLYRWTDEGWKEVWRKQAVSNSLPAGKLEIGALYWLANISRGREELPFVITADGRQEFPHASRLNLLDKNHN